MLGGGRVVAAGRLLPRTLFLKQVAQIPRRVGDVGRRIERVLQRVEGVGVIVKVDLHATDVDVADAVGLQVPHLGDGRRLGRQIAAPAFRHHRPRPRHPGAGDRILAPGFVEGDGGEQMFRGDPGPFLTGDGIGAQPTGVGEGGRQRRRRPRRQRDGKERNGDQSPGQLRASRIC